MLCIANDETEHAVLAWSTLAWALERAASEADGGEVVAQLREQAKLLAAEYGSLPALDAGDRDDDAGWPHHGRLSARSRQHIRSEAYRELIAPTLELLLAPYAAHGRSGRVVASGATQVG